MRLFFVEFAGDTDFFAVARADSALSAAASLMSAARAGSIVFGQTEVGNVTDLAVQEIPSRTGKTQNFGALERHVFPVSDIPKIDGVRADHEPETRSGLSTDVFLVRIDDGNGDEWFYVVEASSAEQARDIALDAGEIENGIDTIVVDRAPEEDGEAGILSMEQVIKEDRRNDPEAGI